MQMVRKLFNFHDPKNLLPDKKTTESEYENRVFPVSKIFDCDDWHMGYQDYWNFDRDESKFFNQFRREVISNFNECLVPVIQIPRETRKEAICLIFDKMNTRGLTLTVFELLTATFASEDFDLREDWDKRYKQLKEKHPVLEELENTNFSESTYSTRHQCKPKTTNQLHTSGDITVDIGRLSKMGGSS